MRRFVPPEEKLFTWWSYRSPNWERSDRGRRLDHIWVTPDLAPEATRLDVLKEARHWERPSDHVPGDRHLRLKHWRDGVSPPIAGVRRPLKERPSDLDVRHPHRGIAELRRLLHDGARDPRAERDGDFRILLQQPPEHRLAQLQHARPALHPDRFARRAYRGSAPARRGARPARSSASTGSSPGFVFISLRSDPDTTT